MRPNNVGIGEASRRTGVHIETIRYYEKIGILPSAPRTGGGHRAYSDGLLRRLTFISRSRELGFSLDEIRKLLALMDAETASCDEVRDLALDHIHSIKMKITDLQRLESVLSELAEQCRGGQISNCPIVDALSQDGAVH